MQTSYKSTLKNILIHLNVIAWEEGKLEERLPYVVYTLGASCGVCNKSNRITAEIATKNFQTLQTVKVWHTTVVLPGLQAGLAKSSIMPVTQGGDELMAKPYPFGPLFHQD